MKNIRQRIIAIYDLNIKNLPLVLAIFCLLVQQMITALNSVWLTEMTKGFQSHQILYVPLILFLLSLIVPALPGALQTYFTQRWSLQQQKKFWQSYQEQCWGRVGQWLEKDLAQSKTSLALREGPSVIHDGCYYVLSSLSLIINVVLNVSVVVFLLDATFLYAFIVGFGLSFLTVYVVSPKIRELAEKEESLRQNLNGPLMASWDNLVLGNALSRKNWSEVFLSREMAYQSLARWNALFRESMTAILSILSMTPVMICVGYYVYTHSNDFIQLLALTVLLNKLFVVLSHGNSLIYQMRDSLILFGRLQFMFSAWDTEREVDLLPRVQFDKIQIIESAGHDQESSIEFYENIQHGKSPKTGYWTLVGDNGSGKTTLLLLLKMLWGEQAFYLPAHHQLVFKGDQKGSTGQKMLQHLDEIFTTAQVPILLLDEWDANLDVTNRQKILGHLRQMSQRYLIIDIRHSLKLNIAQP